MGNEKDVTVVEETQFHLNSQLQHNQVQHDQVQHDQVQHDQVQHDQVQQDQVQQDQVQKEEPTSMSEATQKQTSSSPHLSLVGSRLTGAQLGIASGRWIVDYQWIKHSLENEGQVALPVSMYEV
ncbi:hypothetical protein EMCRGX_G028660 [Ephydatia muelleri]